MDRTERIGVVGLGYVGLPVAVELARHFDDVIGFDIDAGKVAELRSGHDRTGEIEAELLRASRARYSHSPSDLADRTFHVVAVPTPIDRDNRPDFSHLIGASETVGTVLQRGACVVYESTVYPGATEEICAPILERASGLRSGIDFKRGLLSRTNQPGRPGAHAAAHHQGGLRPGRRDPGTGGEGLRANHPGGCPSRAEHHDRRSRQGHREYPARPQHRPDERAGPHLRSAWIRTADVLAAANTKWNFLPFTPGLVGGHCIGVDPYYLTTKAQQLGYQPEVILAGRRINNRMSEHIATTLVKLLTSAGVRVSDARVGVLGLTFKENVPDLRNSRVPDIVATLAEYGIDALVHDPLASPDEAQGHYGLSICSPDELVALDGLVLAVPHDAYLREPRDRLFGRLRDGGVFMDVRSAIPPRRNSLAGSVVEPLSGWRQPA